MRLKMNCLWKNPTFKLKMHSQVKMVEAIESCVEPAEQACNKEMGQDKEHR